MRILALSGSLPAGSSNTALLHALADLAPAGVVAVHPPLDRLPYFSPDAEPTPAVDELRAAIGAADGVVIASPEYANSLPGVLKNALDWIVGSGELYDQPVAVLCASPRIGGGALGRGAIEQTLRAQGARIVLSETVLIRKANPLADELGRDTTTAILQTALAALTTANGTPRA